MSNFGDGVSVYSETHYLLLLNAINDALQPICAMNELHFLSGCSIVL
jgi:hypothetical protein